MSRHPVAVLLVLAALGVSACGEGEPEISEGGAPAVTTPRSDEPYETGGADGSGANGFEGAGERAGIAAGPDSSDPGDVPGADKKFSPPRGGTGR